MKPASRALGFAADVGLVLAAYVVVLVFENLAIGLGYRAEFANSSEMGAARLYLSPIALACSLPIAAGIAVVARDPRPALVAGLGAISGVAVGIGVSTGRLMASLAMRAPFVLVVAALGGGAGWVVARKVAPLRRGQIALLGIFVGLGAWLADVFAFPRLYPAFHLALLGVVLVATSGLLLPLRGSRAGRNVAYGALALALLSAAWTPYAAARLATQDNLRRILLERAPIHGPAVVVASRIAPPPPIEDDEVATSTLTSLKSNGGSHALSFRGRDIVLVTIDALRADHVSAYGYPRKTTPHIDAIAARGVRFERAYCPTPHTSYSIASMMTGKYMKALVALRGEDAADDETWPVQLQRYGYRTGGFYPPAVFFIDEHRFRRMRDTHLGFEYHKEEFAGPALRAEQVRAYLAATPKDRPVFVWVHLFEPHEPYVMHPEHPFSGDPKFDAYDSEIAAADALVGELEVVFAERGGDQPVFIVSADHGEEHGDHGGRYHGTTVYEEQVRVPLVVAVPGLAPRVVPAPVQTIDLLPTTLAALDVPIPPRLRGRDLGPAIAGTAPAGDEGLAFAETDDYTLVARGSDRLVCARKIASCTLFDVAKDPAQKHPDTSRPARVAELKKLTAAIERETGRVEASTLPDALRRGLQGDLDAAEDVAPLLDDVRVDIRRLAARCAFRLKAPLLVTQLRRSAAQDADPEVRRWAALALARIGEEGARSAVEELFASSAPGSEERVAAALTLGEHGDARGEGDLVARWADAFTPDTKTPGEIDEARALLAVFATLRSKAAVPALVRSLEDLRLRPYLVETLGAIGDPRAKEPLLLLFASERYVHLRPLEARALLAVGAKTELLAPLERFAGVPEPMVEALPIAREAKLLAPERGGTEGGSGKLRLAKAGPARLLMIATAEPRPQVDGVMPAAPSEVAKGLWMLELGTLPAGEVQVAGAGAAAWLVPRSEEIPPPAPKAWDAGGL
ncbi:MAG: sulfatase-like hydrolase/transferase [Labilithrix sp.]|nr:sulfatase-like hydrolase/transferase [Labilithrix sp.]MCW5814163.1 sulfatase-like hydrolase/transferase [Labilithrix sp.]